MILRLRSATANDLELTYGITEAAMREYVEQTWGRWDPDEQRRRHTDNFTPQTHRIILLGAAVTGLMAVEHRPDHVWLAKLYLLPDFRGQGIGSTLLRQVLEDARRANKPVRLRILRVNDRGRQFYLRCGFELHDETHEHLYMQCMT